MDLIVLGDRSSIIPTSPSISDMSLVFTFGNGDISREGSGSGGSSLIAFGATKFDLSVSFETWKANFDVVTIEIWLRSASSVNKPRSEFCKHLQKTARRRFPTSSAW